MSKVIVFESFVPSYKMGHMGFNNDVDAGSTYFLRHVTTAWTEKIAPCKGHALSHFGHIQLSMLLGHEFDSNKLLTSFF